MFWKLMESSKTPKCSPPPPRTYPSRCGDPAAAPSGFFLSVVGEVSTVDASTGFCEILQCIENSLLTAPLKLRKSNSQLTSTNIINQAVTKKEEEEALGTSDTTRLRFLRGRRSSLPGSGQGAATGRMAISRKSP